MFMASSASAAIITKTFDFTAHSFAAWNATPPPVDPVIGSITVTFDDAITTIGATSGITINNLNIALSSAIAYDHLSSGWLRIGGLNQGVSGLGSGHDDFVLFIANPSQENFTFTQLAYYTTGSSSIWETTSFGDLPSAVPEPATWAMMIIGFGAVGSMVRTSRRRNAFSAA